MNHKEFKMLKKFHSMSDRVRIIEEHDFIWILKMLNKYYPLEQIDFNQLRIIIYA